MDDDSNLRRIVANPGSGVSPESPEFAFALELPVAYDPNTEPINEVEYQKWHINPN
jgi:hypothetical protein